jgi:hypothetical protein
MGLTRPRAYQIFDIDYKQSVRVVTVANVTLAGGAPNQVDGVNLSTNDRVLVTGQSTASQNGLYYVTNVGTGSNGTWQRSVDGNETGEIDAGMVVMVTEGLVYADTQWKLITDDPIVIGTTALVFVQNYSANSITGGNSNVVVNSNSNVTISVAGASNVLNVTSTGLIVAGNILPSANVTYNIGSNTQRFTDLWLSNSTIYLGNVTLGATATELTVNGATVVTSSGSSTLSLSGNITGGNLLTGGQVSATGNITGNYIIGNGYTLTSVNGSNVSGTVGSATTAATVTTNAQPNITSVGILSSLSVTANVTGGNLITGGLVSATGNITGGNVSATNLTGTLTTASQPNVTSVGTLSSLTVTANITGGNVLTGGIVSASGNINSGANIVATANVVGGNVLTGGIISATGNITGGNIATAGQVSTTGNITGGNILGGANVNATTHTGTTVSVTANVVGGNVLTGGIVSATGNINSGANIVAIANVVGGNLITGGIVSATGNITGGNISGTNLTGTLTTSAQPNITSLGTLTSLTVTANVSGGNLLTGGVVSSTGNVNGANLVASNWVRTANVSATGNIMVDGYVSVVGNLYVSNIVAASNLVVQDPLLYLTANSPYPYNYDIGFFSHFIGDPGNTYQHTGIVRDYTDGTWKIFSNAPEPAGSTINLNNAIYDPLRIGALTSTSGNFSSSLSVTSNITGGNLITGGIVSATGNITGGNISGTNLTGTLTTASQPNITSLGTLTSLNSGAISSSGNITGGNILGGANVNATTHTGTTVSVTANITGGNVLTGGIVSATGNITGNQFNGSGAGLTAIPGGNVTGTVALATSATTAATVTTASQPNITSLGTLTSLTVTANVSGGNITTGGEVSATANITGGNLITGGIVSATGNITGGNISGTNLTGTLTTASQPNITSLGTLSLLTATGNITGGNLITGGLISATGNIIGGNVTATNLTGTLTTASQPNITSVGNLSSLTVTGNTTSGNLITSGLISAAGNLTVGNITTTIANVTTFNSAQGGNVSGTLVATSANAQFFNQTNGAGYVTVAGYLSAAGNITGGNLLTGGSISSTGNITGGNISATLITGTLTTASQPNITNVGTLGSLAVTANITGGNVLTVGRVSATGNVNGGNIISGALVQGAIVSASGNVVGGNLTTSGQISATSNITGGNVLTGGLISATSTITSSANITGGNVLTGGLISATGTITTAAGTNSTGFAVGNGAVSNVGLGFFPTAGTRGDYAIRDYSNVTSTMYLDVGMGGSAAGEFQFRTSNAFTLLMRANSTGVYSPGVVSATGIVSGLELTSTQSSGDEGGQLNLAKAATNTTLDGNIIVDIYQNRFRIFENGGTNRGAYIDLTAAAASVGTNLLAGGGGGTPGGSNTYVQFNDGGVFGGNAQFTYDKVLNTLTAGTFAGTLNGSGQNFKVGDDAWIGDINTADTIGLKGQQNAANAYIVFGNSDATGKLGRAGTGPLTYAGAFSATSNVTGGNILTGGIVSATGNITGGNLIVTGNIVDTGPLSIVTTSNGNITLAPNGTGVVVLNTDLRNGQANGVGNIGAPGAFFNVAHVRATSAQYADLAENYVADAEYEPGTVLVFGGEFEVTQSTQHTDPRVAGVVSTHPAYLMNSGLNEAFTVPVAFQGRVPCRVQGPVNKGDVLVTGTVPGVAQRIWTDWQPGCTLGKSLGTILDNTINVIEIVVGRF